MEEMTDRLQQGHNSRSGDCGVGVIRGLPGEHPDLTAVQRPGGVAECQVCIVLDGVRLRAVVRCAEHLNLDIAGSGVLGITCAQGRRCWGSYWGDC